MILNLIGDGKGKTTSAYGTVLRAINKHKILIIQFLKDESKENEVLSKFKEIDTYNYGLKEFYFPNKNKKKYQEVIKKGWKKFKEIKKDYDFILLDELNWIVHYGFIEVEEVIDEIREFKLSKDKHLIITGRVSNVRLRELSDTISEVNNIKHYYDKLGSAIEGLDF
ncbi:MAG: cob(I)yrinic acid a,c-diamide adenosyltransferase [Candidatus Woesearchaeota archaeon]